METKYIILFAALAAAVLGLSIYLGFLLRKLKAQRDALARAGEAANLARSEREADIRQSLRTLALVIIQEQVEPTEGCIRVKKLMDEIDYLKDREELAVFHEMYEEVKDFAILRDYKDLSKQEAFRQDNRRYVIEDRFNPRLKRASQVLRDILSRPH